MNRPLSRRLRALLGVYALSCVGTGLVFPFTAIYLVAVRGVGSGAAGAFFGVIAVTSFLTAPFAGRLVDRWGSRGMCAAGVLAQAIGYTLLAGVDNQAWLIACAVVVGLGNGTFYPAFTPLLAAMLDQDQRKRGFSYRYLAMNLGLGVGAALAGVLVGRVSGVAGYQLLYVLDGTSFLPLAATVLLAGPRARREAAAPPTQAGDYRALLRSRPLLILLAAQTLLVLFGYSQIDTAIPLLLTQRLGVAASLVGLMIAVNTVAVVVLQAPLGRLLERGSSVPVLAGCAGIWSVAAAIGLAAALAPANARMALILIFAVIFAVGETCYAVAYQPLLTELTPPQLLGRSSALSSLSWNTGAMAGPAIGIVVAGALPAAGYWILYGALLALTALLVRSLRQPAPAVPSTVMHAPSEASGS